MNFNELLLLIITVIFLFSLGFSVLEMIRTSRPEYRTYKLWTFLPGTILYFLLSLSDIKWALTALSASTTVGDAVWPILRTGLFTALYTGQTMVYSRRQDRFEGRHESSGQIIGGIILASILVVLLGVLAASVASGAAATGWLQVKSTEATRLSAAAFFVLYGSAAYLAGYLLFTDVRFKWLPGLLLCAYTVIAISNPPAPVRDARDQLLYAWGDGIRPFVLGMIFAVGIFQLIHHVQAVYTKKQDAVLKDAVLKVTHLQAPHAEPPYLEATQPELVKEHL